MRRAIIVILIGFTVLGPARAADLDSLFTKANEAYSRGFYLEAIDQYLKIVDMGYESAELYFNTGNACFKLEDYPLAILYYEKARKIDPNDEDINHNLAIANTRIVDKIEPVPEIFFKSWWRSFLNLMKTDGWAIMSIGAFTLFFVLFAFYLLSKTARIRKLAFFSGIVVLFVAVFTFFVSLQKYRSYNLDREAIVFTPTITVKSSPNPNSVDLFVIHEGAKVSLMDEVGEWYEIRIANGSVGWLPASAIRKI